MAEAGDGEGMGSKGVGGEGDGIANGSAMFGEGEISTVKPPKVGEAFGRTSGEGLTRAGSGSVCNGGTDG